VALMRTIIAYAASLATFLALDGVWLTVMGPRLYKPVLGDLLANRINGTAVIVFYLIYLLGLTLLAIAPAVKEGSWTRAMFNGLVLGVVAYATYDLTNQATLKVWATRITLADIAWGAFATSLAALAGFLAARRITH
jgi:uncharacterized membrane protein